jgi:hypothetical protein
MKKLTDLYNSPTPKFYRKIGDALLGVSTIVTTYAIAEEWSKYLQLSALILGVVGKFLTNFFSEEQ